MITYHLSIWGVIIINSKERVLTTIAHKEPDRVPVGEWGIDHDHVSRVLGRHTYWRNRKDTTLALWDNRRDEVVEGMKRDCVDIVNALDYDIVTVELVPPKSYHVDDKPRLVREGVWEDKSGNVFKYAASNDAIFPATFPEAKFELTDEDVERAIEEADNIDPSEFELLDFVCDKFGKDKAILFRGIDTYFKLLDPFGGGVEHQLMVTCIAPEEIRKLWPACLKYNQALIDHCAEKGVNIIMSGHDYGMNTGCIMNPNTIRSEFFPMMKEVNCRINAIGKPAFFHCCGRVWDILDDFIDAGFVGYQSIQESAGMDNRRIKEMYGDKLTMWTGVQCETLILGSLEDTEKEVMKNMDLLMPGGGFIFGSTNSVQYGAKTDNYLRALELVRKYGVY